MSGFNINSKEIMLELLDIIDEIEDRDTLKTVAEGRKAVKAGAKGKSVANLFGKI